MKFFKKMVSLAMASAMLMGFGVGINADSSLKISSIFPDKALMNIVKKEFDSNSDGYLNSTEISKAKAIHLDGVADMEGLQYLTSCKTIYISSSKMGSVNLSNYRNVETCYVLEADSVKTFIGGPGLKTLYINGSGITSISLQRSRDLVDFTLIYNKTYSGELNLSRNSKLKHIRFESDTKLEGIQFPKNAEVEQIMCDNLPNVHNIDISTSVKLSSLQCVYFTGMNIRSYRLPGDVFNLMCFRKEYAQNGQYIYLG